MAAATGNDITLRQRVQIAGRRKAGARCGLDAAIDINLAGAGINAVRLPAALLIRCAFTFNAP